MLARVDQLLPAHREGEFTPAEQRPPTVLLAVSEAVLRGHGNIHLFGIETHWIQCTTAAYRLASNGKAVT
jgi:hypothetical protein